MSNVAKLNEYRGTIPLEQIQNVNEYLNAGLTRKEIQEKLSKTLDQEISIGSVRSFVNYINKTKRTSIDHDFIDKVSEDIKKDFERIETLTVQLEGIGSKLIKEDLEMGLKVADRLIKLYSLKTSFIKDARDNTKGSGELSREEMQELAEHTARRLSLKR